MSNVQAAPAHLFPPADAVELFGLLGGGKRDPGRDGSGRPVSQLAILPGLTHYNIGMAPSLATTVIPFSGYADSEVRGSQQREEVGQAGPVERSVRRAEPRDAARVRVFPPGVPLVAVLIGVGLEREHEFGEEYLSYQRSVRRWQ